MKSLTVGDLRKALEGVADNTPVLVSGGQDHTFRIAYTATGASAGFHPRSGAYYQWYGKEYSGESVKETKIVLLE